MSLDKCGCFMRSNAAIHAIFPPPPKACILLFESSSGTKQKVCNLLWLPTAYPIRSTPGPGIQTILQCDPPFPSRPPLLRVQGLWQTLLPETDCFHVSTHIHVHPSWKNHPDQSHCVKCHPILPVSSRLPFP